LDSNVWGNATFDDLTLDAEKALDVFIQQPEVDANHVTLVGHSEGTTIVPRVAIDNPDIVDNIVLMGVVAQNFSNIGYFQGVTLPILYVQQVLDHDHNGLISVQEASENPVFSSIVGNLTLALTQNVTTANFERDLDLIIEILELIRDSHLHKECIRYLLVFQIFSRFPWTNTSYKTKYDNFYRNYAVFFADLG
jgi:pimeloyl-ACP methyl ester carboxylesterase